MMQDPEVEFVSHWMHVQVFESQPQGLKICWAEVEEVFAKMNARSKAPAPFSNAFRILSKRVL